MKKLLGLFAAALIATLPFVPAAAEPFAAAEVAAPATITAPMDSGSLGEETIAAPALNDAEPEPEPTVQDVIEDFKDMVNDWRTAGAVAGLIALAYLLVRLTKVGTIARYIEEKGIKWIRPLLALLIASLTAALASLETGASPLMAAIHGLLAGLAAPGLDQLFQSVKAALGVSK